MRKFVIAIACLFVCSILTAQDFTNKGKDFWLGYGNHVRMFTVPVPSTTCNGNANTCPEKMQVYITSDVNTTGTIEIPSVGFTQAFTITANQITTIDIPRTAALPDEGLYNHGIHIVSALPVVVYSFIYVSAVSGATLCLPTNVLGREYYSVNYKQLSNESNSYSYFFVLATEDNSTVEITPSVKTKGGRPANIPFTVVLNKGQIYQVLGASTSNSAGGDLTGSRIRSISTGAGCKKIAVFCGSGKISIGCGNAGSSDNLYQQMYPNSSWGKKYITTPSTNNGSNFQINFYRIIRPDITATVTLNGTVLNTGFSDDFYYEFNSNITNVIESDKPILVVQYFTTSGAGVNCGNSGIGDPDMVYLNPVEQTIQKVTLNSMQPASNTAITTHFINVVLKNQPAIINSFRVDGNAYGSSFSPVAGDNNYAYARLNVSAGTHNLICDSGFNAIAYGFGNAESYGYSAGSNLRDLYQFVSIQNQYATVNFPAGCKNSPFKFSITLPYQPTSLQWEFNGLFNDTSINSPTSDSSWIVNGRTLYRYTIDKNYTISNKGTYPISIIADNPTTDGCSGEQQIDYDLQIFDRPSAHFTTSFTGCLNDSTKFSDASDGMSREIIHRFWDFGDLTKDDINKNPEHLYTIPKEYSAKLSIVTDVGCLSDTATVPIIVNPLPASSFNISSVTCAGKPVLLTNTSVISQGSIASSSWTFGDGTISAEKDPSHVYTSTQNYSVSLITISDKGCSSGATTTPVTIHYVPTAAFETPEICLSDASAAFTDKSTIADNSAGAFTYLWNFGDASASAGNLNTDTKKDGQHKYSQAADFNVSLTVTSRDGCADDTTVLFTVNGSIPKADFSVADAVKLCSNVPVKITDKSTVDFGKITKVEIYWDYLNDPLKKTIDEDPAKNKSYSYLYDDSGAPASRNFTIKYFAYSGINCVNEAAQIITLHATPQLKFDAIPAVCAEAASVVFTEAAETSGVAGSGTYSGAATGSSGSFAPASAAIGSNTIRYTFTSLEGCTSFKEQVVQINPTPVVSAGPDRLILEGTSIIMAAKASGGNLTYNWTPPNWLNDAGILTPTASSAQDITYTLTATSSEGCTGKDNVRVYVLRNLKVPNAFSPNGDRINDVWEIPHLSDYPGNEVEIYSRTGQRIYISYGYSRPWDGTINGQPVPFGTYYWIIKPKNGRPPMNGSVTVIR